MYTIKIIMFVIVTADVSMVGYHKIGKLICYIVVKFHASLPA